MPVWRKEDQRKKNEKKGKKGNFKLFFHAKYYKLNEYLKYTIIPCVSILYARRCEVLCMGNM